MLRQAIALLPLKEPRALGVLLTGVLREASLLFVDKKKQKNFIHLGVRDVLMCGW